MRQLLAHNQPHVHAVSDSPATHSPSLLLNAHSSRRHSRKPARATPQRCSQCAAAVQPDSSAVRSLEGATLHASGLAEQVVQTPRCSLVQLAFIDFAQRHLHLARAACFVQLRTNKRLEREPLTRHLLIKIAQKVNHQK